MGSCSARLTTLLLAALSSSPAAASPIPQPSRCFRAVNSERHRSYLLLWPAGTYQHAETEDRRVLWLDQGSWRARSTREFELTSDLDAWSLETPRLYIEPSRLFNVPLIRDLKAGILRFLQAHRGESTFTYEQINVIQVLGGPCPDADSYVCRGPCDGPRSYGVNVQPKPMFPDEPITRSQLLKIARLIDEYLDRSDLNVFHMSIANESGFRLVYFDRSGTGYAFRASTEREVRSELRDSLRMRWPGDPPNPPLSLVEVGCSEIDSEREVIPLPPDPLLKLR